MRARAVPPTGAIWIIPGMATDRAKGLSDPQPSRRADLCQGFGRSTARVAGRPGSSLESSSARHPALLRRRSATGPMKRRVLSIGGTAQTSWPSGEELPARSRREGMGSPAPGGRSAGSAKECAVGELRPGSPVSRAAQVLSRARPGCTGPRERAPLFAGGGRPGAREVPPAPAAVSCERGGRWPRARRWGGAGLGPPSPEPRPDQPAPRRALPFETRTENHSGIRRLSRRPVRGARSRAR